MSWRGTYTARPHQNALNRRVGPIKQLGNLLERIALLPALPHERLLAVRVISPWPICHLQTPGVSLYKGSAYRGGNHLAALDLPVQIFWGGLDMFLLVDNGRGLQQRLKRSRLRVFERCGHYSYQDKADEFAEMALSWARGRIPSHLSEAGDALPTGMTGGVAHGRASIAVVTESPLVELEGGARLERRIGGWIALDAGYRPQCRTAGRRDPCPAWQASI
jgi:hypothetical protein